MAELISVTLPNGQTEIINLDYVVKIEGAHQNKSSITIANLVPMLAIPMLVKGPGHPGRNSFSPSNARQIGSTRARPPISSVERFEKSLTLPQVWK
jgi:hypothetical protein